jgi:hypothetical protein
MNSPLTPGCFSKLEPRQAAFTATQEKAKPKSRVKAQATLAPQGVSSFGKQQAEDPEH